MTFALELRGISKSFGGVTALDGASLDVRPGTVHALLGENGAGKTTLMRIAYGMVRSDRGEMRLSGTPYDPDAPSDAIAAGVGTVHQHFTLVPAFTVAENVVLGRRGRFSLREARAVTDRVAADARLPIDAGATVAELGVAAQQRVEILKAIARDARLLILDEPTAVLAPAEAAELLRWLRAFVEGGRSAILITHKLRDALATADDVTVLRRGRMVASGPSTEFTADSLASAMLGAPSLGAESRGGPPTKKLQPDTHDPVTIPTPSVAPSRASSTTPGDVVVDARSLAIDDARGVSRINDATFSIRAGDVVGIAAVEGSGQRELLRALAGRMTPSRGTLQVPASVAFIPEDRHHEAAVLEMSLTENVALRGLARARGLMRWREREQRTSSLMLAHDVRATSASSAMRTLSGGNQQKLVLARELDPLPSLVIAENPTRGLDVRATQAVLDRLAGAAAAGAAVVMYSSDLDEILAVAHRVLVVHAGVVEEAALDAEDIGRRMLGTATPATTTG